MPLQDKDTALFTSAEDSTNTKVVYLNANKEEIPSSDVEFGSEDGRPMRFNEDTRRWERLTKLEVPDGAVLLDDLAAFLETYVAFPSKSACYATALWGQHTHAIEAFESTPRLMLISPEKGSGKTRCLEVLDLIVPEPMHASSLSSAALFRQVASKQPTILMDEADTYLGLRVAKDHEELRGLINAGHRRGAVAYRCVGEPSKMEVQEFPAFAAAAIAGIGDFPDTIIDRSVVIKMRRRAPHEQVRGFRLRRVRPEGEELRTRCAAWAEANLERLSDAEPEMPGGIVDRPADVWEALLAIADAAGGEWPERARKACVELNRERQSSDPSLGVQLLADIRRVFEETDSDRVSSKDLVEKLCAIEEAPWGDLRGKPIDPRGVARRLKPFGVGPKQIRLSETVTRKGYEVGDFLDPWDRYLSLPQNSETNETDATAQVTGADSVTDTAAVSDTNETRNQGETESMPTTSDVAPVSAVSPSGPRQTPESRNHVTTEERPMPEWSWSDEARPCIVCDQDCIAIDPEGRVRHPACPFDSNNGHGSDDQLMAVASALNAEVVGESERAGARKGPIEGKTFWGAHS